MLARVALTAAEHGDDAALARHAHELRAAARLLGRKEAALSVRRVEGLTPHPARPGSYVRDLAGFLDRLPLTRKAAKAVRSRLRTALAYAVMALRQAEDMLDEGRRTPHPAGREAFDALAATSLAAWRAEVGHFSPARVPTWPMSARQGSAEQPNGPGEVAGDQLWLAELADTIARLHGHEAAEIGRRGDELWTDTDPRPGPEDTFAVDSASIAAAAASAAHLAGLTAGRPPGKPRTWDDLSRDLIAAATAAEDQIGPYALPPVLAAAEGTALPGTEVRIEVARSGSRLAAWAGYMGNCLADGYYAGEAAAGRVVLIALRAGDTILANAELRPSGKGWRIEQVMARFNEDPDPALASAFRDWVRSLPAREEDPPTEPGTGPWPALRTRATRPAHPRPHQPRSRSTT